MTGVISSASLLSVSRSLYSGNGIGLSSSARALTEQFLNTGGALFGSLSASSSLNNQIMNQITAARLEQRVQEEEAAGRTGLSRRLSGAILGSQVNTSA
jgi:hypothetical protein